MSELAIIALYIMLAAAFGMVGHMVGKERNLYDSTSDDDSDGFHLALFMASTIWPVAIVVLAGLGVGYLAYKGVEKAHREITDPKNNV